MSSEESDLDDSWFIVNSQGDVINLSQTGNISNPVVLEDERDNLRNDAVAASVLNDIIQGVSTVLPLETDENNANVLPDKEEVNVENQNADLPTVKANNHDQNELETSGVDTVSTSKGTARQKDPNDIFLPKIEVLPPIANVVGLKETTIQGKDAEILLLHTRKAEVEVKMKEVIPQYDEIQCSGPSVDPRLRKRTGKRQSSSSSDISLVDEPSHTSGQYQNFAPVDAHKFIYAPPSLMFQTEEKPPEKKKIATKSVSSQTVRRYQRRMFRAETTPLPEPSCLLFMFTAVAGILLILSTFNGTKPKPEATELLDKLGAIHRHILACLGQQHLTMIQSNETLQKIYMVCDNSRTDYRQQIVEKLLDGDVQAFLISAQKMLVENDSADFSMLISANISELNINLMVMQLEYYELLPSLLKKPFFQENSQKNPSEIKVVLNQFEEIAKNLSLFSHELRNLIDVLSIDESRKTHGSKSRIIEGLDALLDDKMQNLYAQYKTMEIAIENLKKESEISKEDGTNKEKKGHSFIQNQIDLLTRLQENTLNEVKNLYKFLFETSSSNDNMNSKDYGGWSLEMLKKNVEGYIQEARTSIKETVEDYKGDVSKVLTSFVKEGKKHAEETLNIVTDYFKEAEEGTRNILKEQLPGNVMDGIWNVWENLKYKNPNADSDNMRFQPDQATENEESTDQLKATPTADDVEFDLQMKDWFFERAAVREQVRDLPKEAVNWYLAREKLRERQRKANEDQKQKESIF